MKSIFNIHTREQKGIAWLVLIIVILMSANLYLTQIYKTPPLNIVVTPLDAVVKKDSVVFFKFNPNTISKDSLLLLGVSEMLAKQWVNYRSKAKQFKSISDLKKLYAMTDTVFNALESWMVWPQPTQDNKAKANRKKIESKREYAVPSKSMVININAAGEEDWKKIHGIGDVYANRITKYRDLLGGFYNSEQIKEVYGMSDSLFEQIFTNMSLEIREKPKRMKINQATAEQLAKHPYISWSVANSLVKYRKQHGFFKHLSEIKQSILVTDSLYLRISEYLTVDTLMKK